MAEGQLCPAYILNNPGCDQVPNVMMGGCLRSEHQTWLNLKEKIPIVECGQDTVELLATEQIANDGLQIIWGGLQ